MIRQACSPPIFLFNKIYLNIDGWNFQIMVLEDHILEFIEYFVLGTFDLSCGYTSFCF